MQVDANANANAESGMEPIKITFTVFLTLTNLEPKRYGRESLWFM